MSRLIAEITKKGPNDEIRRAALRPLCASSADDKVVWTQAIALDGPVDAAWRCDEPAGLPGRPPRPELVAPQKVRQRSMHTAGGRAAMIHALAHIEFNAIDLALDIVWRYPDMPEAFYRDWIGVAHDEARHFGLLRDHLRVQGHDYGDFTAHDALWLMAARTRGDLLARVELVHRTMEARGLDASPPMRDKLASAGDARGADIVDIILHDEIGHVAVANRWYHWLCERDGLDPVRTAERIARDYHAPRPKAPFNVAARRAAGFGPDEIARLDLPTH